MSENQNDDEVVNADLTEAAAAVLASFGEVKIVMNELEIDVIRSSKGNSAAGTRSRKAARLLKRQIKNVIDGLLVIDKIVKSRRAARRAELGTPKRKGFWV